MGNKEIRINGEQQSNHRLSDGILIFSNSPEELGNILNGLADVTLKRN